MTIRAYIRVSTDRQTIENQRYEILKFSNLKQIVVNEWIEETESGTVKIKDRLLGQLINKLQKGDTLIVSEISRLGRKLLDVMSILNEIMLKECFLLSVKEGFELGDNINSKVLAFAFSLSGELERTLISARTKEALARRKANGQSLGRPVGFRLKNTKLSGKEEEIKNLLKHKVSVRAIARMYGVHPVTVREFILKCKLI
jgi:DNA invertase Pin-like site-specific DNA recombinase